MNRNISKLILGVLCLAMVFSATWGNAGESEQSKLSIGDSAPVWKKLPGVDGENHSLSDLKDSELVVAFFTCCGCPVVHAYEDRFNEFAEEYKGKGVRLVGINVNKNENLLMMQQRAQEKDYKYDYLFDKSQKIARQYEATCTPHLFVLNKDRKIAYTGAFDDGGNQPKKHYLRDAVDALLAGRQPKVTQTRQFGCGIKWKKN